MKVSVFGLGYVGAVSCACLPELGHEVVGVDINPLKVELIASGQSPVVEEGIEELIAAAVKAGKLTATADVARAVRDTEVSLTNRVEAEGIVARALHSAGRSRRMIASVSTNWSPWRGRGEDAVQRFELGLFGAVRAKLDGFDDQRIAGTTLLTGLDLRFGLTPRLAIGGSATLRSNLGDGTTRVAYGPQVSITPTKDMVLSLGYTLSGYRDRDFAESRSTRQGVFASLRMKFDADSLGLLGLGRR